MRDDDVAPDSGRRDGFSRARAVHVRVCMCDVCVCWHDFGTLSSTRRVGVNEIANGGSAGRVRSRNDEVLIIYELSMRWITTVYKYEFSFYMSTQCWQTFGAIYRRTWYGRNHKHI